VSRVRRRPDQPTWDAVVATSGGRVAAERAAAATRL